MEFLTSALPPYLIYITFSLEYLSTRIFFYSLDILTFYSIAFRGRVQSNEDKVSMQPPTAYHFMELMTNLPNTELHRQIYWIENWTDA